MQNIYPIFKKELRTYFNSPIAYIFLVIFLVLSNIIFCVGFMIWNQADLSFIFGTGQSWWMFLPTVPLLLTLFVPAITMRLIAEEKRSGTLEVLVTMPIRESEIILGKYLAALFLIVVAIGLTFTYPLTISLLGNPDGGHILCSYLGLVLLGASFLAVGMFFSALTKNQIVAFIMSLVVVFLLVMLELFLFFASLFGLPQSIISILEPFAMYTHFQNIAKGVIDTRDLMYSLSLIFVGLFLATCALTSRKAK